MDESIRLLEFFGGSAATQTCPYSSNIWRRKSGRMPNDIRYLVKKFRITALRIIEKAEEKKVKDYYRVTVLPDPEECARWAEKHAGDFSVPPVPPPRKKKRYFRDLRDFGFIAGEFLRNPEMTEEEVKNMGGSSYVAPIENGLMAYLRSITKKAG